MILLRKQFFLNETLIEQNLMYKNMFTNISTIIDNIGVKLDDIDYKGSFSSDDEIGWFFNDIKSLYSMLKNFDKVD